MTLAVALCRLQTAVVQASGCWSASAGVLVCCTSALSRSRGASARSDSDKRARRGGEADGKGSAVQYWYA